MCKQIKSKFDKIDEKVELRHTEKCHGCVLDF